MLRLQWTRRLVLGLLLAGSSAFVAGGQAGSSAAQTRITLTVVDENGVVVSGARVTLSEPGLAPIQLLTNYAGRSRYPLARKLPYQLRVDKEGFYQLTQQVDPHLTSVELTLAHQQIVREQVNVVASTSGIDPEQTSNASIMSTPEIVNIPYPTSRDIRNLLPFNPGVVRDATGQVHVAGSATYATLDLLDGFDIRSPVGGNLTLRVSTDAVRRIDIESTRYPVEFGKATGGVIAFSSGMGDNRFRFNTTDFFPSFREINGLHFDKFAPRVTVSGPIVRNKAWFFNGLDMEYDKIFVSGLPSNADSADTWRGSNLAKVQVNLTPNNILIAGLLFNNYHSPSEGLSILTPIESTTKRNTIAWLPYFRDQHVFSSGALLDLGLGILRIRDGYEPHGDTPYEITPEISEGSYFENLTGHSQRVQETAALYLSPQHWAGRHDFKAGLDLDEISFGEEFSLAPVSYLREDGTLLRRSTFPAQTPYTRSNVEIGTYAQDRWELRSGLVVEPGVRFDWDEIVRRPVYSPRFAAVYSPGMEGITKISAGVGLYEEHTQLQYVEQALAGLRTDTYYAADGVTPTGPPLATSFIANYPLLRMPRALNWSVGAERRLPASIYATINYLDRHGRDGFVYANQNGADALSGVYLLTNTRRSSYRAIDISLRRSFAHGYVLFGSYIRSSARTNAALDYSPTLSILGPQGSGPLAWDTPNRAISWGWLPVPKLKNWDFVYTVDWRTGFPFNAVDANRQIVGAPNAQRFPAYLSFSPGLEWRFHLRGSYFGLRGVIENATDSANPTIVNNVVVSPQYGVFSQPQGRALTARIRLINTK